MTQTFRQKYFGSWSFYKSAIAIALPVMTQMLIQSLVSLVDNFMVAGLGDIKMSGVNVAGQILYVFQVLINSICVAGGIFMSQFFGADNERGMKQSLVFKFVLALIGIGIYMFCCMVIPYQILSLMVRNNSDAGAILSVGTQYMFIMGFSGIPATISAVLASALREIGDVKPPLVISVCATFLNTFLDWLLIYGKFGLPVMEVRGAAIATFIAMSLEMAVFIVYIFKKKPPFLLRKKDLFIDHALFFKMLRKCLMTIFSEMILVVSGTYMTALFNSRGGADVVSGMASSFAIANLFFVAFSGITTAIGVMLGKTLGHGDLDQALKDKNRLLMAAMLFGVIMGVIGMMTIALIPLVFGSLSNSAQSICREMVFGIALFMPVMVYVNAQYAVSRAGGDTRSVLFVDCLTTVLLILVGILFTTKYTQLGPVTMYMICRCVDFIRIIVAGVLLKKGRWLKNLTV